MNLGVAPTTFANAVAPFSPVGKQAVGEENTESKNSTLKSIEKSAESDRGQNRTQHKDREKAPVDDALSGKKGGEEKQGDQLNGEPSEKDRLQEQAAEKRRQLQEGEQIRELAARDREVRTHEQAHAAVGGHYAGSPQYQYERGPDGVSYAVSGEVPISTSKVANDPEATITKAQIVRRAALAPAEPSPQDRRVAAQATQMEFDARKDLVQMRQEQTRLEREQRNQETAERAEQEATTDVRAQEGYREQSARDAAFKEQNDLQRSFQQRLVDIGIAPNQNQAGQFIRESV